MAYDRSLKSIITEFFKRYFTMKTLSTERGILFKEYRLDIFVEDPKTSLDFPANSWIGFILNNLNKYLVLELKHVGSKASYQSIIKLLTYKFVLANTLKGRPKDITAVLIVSKIPKALKKDIKEQIDNSIDLTGSSGLYKIIGSQALKVLIIAIDELDLSVDYNELLCLFSSVDDISINAARRILSRYPFDSFIYAFTFIYRPEVSSMARTELIPPERLRMAIDVIGAEKLAEALGPEKLVEVIDAIGAEKLAEALGPEKLLKLILTLLKSLPEDKRKEIQKIFSNKDQAN